MKIKFHGSENELKDRVRRCQVEGVWRSIAASGQHQYKAETGENLNWWPSTGTLTFQGGDVPVLQDRYEALFLPPEIRRAAIALGRRSGPGEAAGGGANYARADGHKRGPARHAADARAVRTSRARGRRRSRN